jgi:hypothetical protein
MRRLRRGSGGLVVYAALLPLALPLGLAACSHQTKAESSVVGMDLYTPNGARTEVGKPLRIFVSLDWDTEGEGNSVPEDMTNEEEAALEDPKEFAWTVSPAAGATISTPAGSPTDQPRPAVFVATKPGTFAVRASSKRHSVEDTLTVKVAAPPQRPTTTTTATDSSSSNDGRYLAELAAGTCTGAAPNETTTTAAAQLEFNVNGKSVTATITASNGTTQYRGRVGSGGALSIASTQPTFTLSVTGTLDAGRVDGVWEITKTDGTKCSPTFSGERV